MPMTRRDFIKLSAMGGALALTDKTSAAALFDNAPAITYRSNPELTTILKGFPGNPTKDGRFLNLNRASSDNSFKTVFKWFVSENPQRDEKRDDSFLLSSRKIPSLSGVTEDGFIWLGHSSFLFHFNRNWILTDPCLTDLPFKKRKAEVPVRISDLSGIDFLLVSHGHYDHLDNETVSQFLSKKTQALVPLEMGALIRSMNRFIGAQEAGWYQEFQAEAPFRIYFLPAKHWHLRAPWDRNKILWGSYLIEYKKKKYYFAGDSAYDSHFSEIGRLFQGIDYCFLPIGAYKPSYIMQSNHMNPEEAYKAYIDLKGRHFIPIHYGTFDLADEPIGEPIRLLKSIFHEKGNPSLLIPEVGQLIPV